jgi:agmatinase
LLEERLGIPICFATWTFHANELIGRNKRVIQLGIRATRFSKEHWESKLDVVQVWSTDEDQVERVVAAARATGLPVYFSNDIDGTDAKDADATGTPEPDGLDVDVVRRLIARLGAEVGLIGGDIVEVAPVLGKDGGKRTLEVASQYLRDTVRELLR